MAEVMVLVVEDEAAISTLIQFTLEQAGFVVQCVSSVEAAQPLLQSRLADMLLVDWMLPGLSGLDFIRQLRNDIRSRDLPIILLTARGEETDKEQGLNLGADDYITKPFSPRELIARINALLRRRAPQKTSVPLRIYGLELDPQEQRVQVNGQTIPFGPSEFKLLHFFMTHPDRIYTRSQLLDLVWGDHVFVEERTVDVHIRRLRRGLETVGHDHLIQTVRGSGYRFSP
ncbi:phosphate regulon transcriptional regulatory protein PhoB [Snodgrassella alvi]|uniref:phosphate regulon transcriptional regulator PhoB n=1 Tax=Snodgrassella TaxID=1193515 RepID=UPI0009FFC480|nr:MULTISPECIES: phosphate regulon transcriptional regulator PhoB [Snodgrassella]MBI0159566.1 phosphate regulon transcriptional regulator PhoB [Snodgrassella sp. W6238H11]MBI0161751.1 phosphate regulon transcriptional regulator PhoB [Snodgrassella sp. W6238H14]MBI0166181.1 phosphate regulon transcriptional regulator PhoB [Snodgrassella sp. M0351]ORF25528.1 phosphate regulon transcriptional regulatory protein PhoB [Snodgrassella alvi]ORF33954.1 phosphate regulon transcriptional regulatory prote